MTAPATTPTPAQTTAPGPRPLRVAGVDVSLTGTAIATLGGTVRIPTTGRRRDLLHTRHARLQSIARGALEAVGDVDLAVIEGPSFHSAGGSAWDRGGLWWLIVDGLLDREIPTAIMPPRCRAKYATGNGNAGKTGVMNAVQHTYGAVFANDDECDSFVLRAAGLDWAGCPLVAVPETHRGGLLGCEWPDYEAVTR
ncbi:hypothetical protein GCM10010400_58140 [Streptomyces aculeolatus]